jgi:hypothetical protein
MSRLNRKNIKLNPEVMKKLQAFKDSIHDFSSKGRVPMTWNEFFMIIVCDWENSRSKCHCGKFYDCDHCRLLDEVGRRRSHGFNGDR